MTRDFGIRQMFVMWLAATALLFTPVSLLAQATNIDAPDNDSGFDLKLLTRIGRSGRDWWADQM